LPLKCRRWLVPLLVLLAIAGAGAGESTLQRIQRTGLVRVGYANEAPFAFTTLDGKLTGESPEIARAIFKRMGVQRTEGVLTEWGSLIPGLRAGRFDVITAGMFILPKRCEQVLFTDPHYRLGQGFLVKKGNPKNLHSYQDVAGHADAVLSVLAGSVERGYARQAAIPNERVLVVPDTAAQVAAVRASRADAAAQTALAVQDMANKGGNAIERATPFVDRPEHVGYGAFAFRKRDGALRDAVNRHLQEWIGSEEHLAVIAPFGFTANELPGSKTAAELCAER
jgi:polar amino acid transport system substrate-binding protein